MYASQSGFAKEAGKALKANSASGITVNPEQPRNGIMPYNPLEPTAPLPTGDIIELMLSTSNYGIRDVAVDPELENKLKKSDEYKELFSHDPSINEIRSKLRDESNLNNGEFTSYLVSEGKLNSNFKNNLPTNIGRTAAKKGTLRFGKELLGNNPSDNRSKRFKVNTR